MTNEYEAAVAKVYFSLCSFQSKHLKGQLDPPVGDGNVFCTKGGQLDPPVGDGNVFCIKGGHLDPPVGDGNVFCTKGGQLDPIFCSRIVKM